LPLAGKKRKLNRAVLVNYYGKERLKLSDKTILKVLRDLQSAIPTWLHLLTVSFLTDDLKEKYRALLLKRIEILELDKPIGKS
jgi:serine/threonine-protein kinase HipA